MINELFPIILDFIEIDKIKTFLDVNSEFNKLCKKKFIKHFSCLNHKINYLRDSSFIFSCGHIKSNEIFYYYSKLNNKIIKNKINICFLCYTYCLNEVKHDNNNIFINTLKFCKDVNLQLNCFIKHNELMIKKYL
jgi:hypothetical protein